MLDYPEKVEAFIQANFDTCEVADADFTHTNASMLEFLFSTFPVDCISDFELYDILMGLGYEKKVVTRFSNTHPVWCFKYKVKPVDITPKTAIVSDSE